MQSKKTGQIFTIILCFALIVTVLVVKVVTKDKEENRETNASKEMQEEQNIDSVDTYQSADSEEESSEETIEKYITDDSKLGGDNLKNADTSLYEEDPAAEKMPEGTTEVKFMFTNADLIYDQNLPSGVYKNLYEEFQKYINANIKDPDTIKELEIVEDSMKLDKENHKFSFKSKLPNESILNVVIDLHTFEYTFSLN